MDHIPKAWISFIRARGSLLPCSWVFRAAVYNGCSNKPVLLFKYFHTSVQMFHIWCSFLTGICNGYVYHVCRDSSANAGREKAAKTAKKDKKPPKKRGRPGKNEVKPVKEPAVIEKQALQDAAASIGELDKACSWGCKMNSQGHGYTWKGYKLHLDVSDLGFPLTAVVTAANVHDSQLAIPMEKLTESKVVFCYSLMDSGYDAQAIDAFIRSCGRIPIIDPNKRNDKNRPPLDPAKQERYKIRTTVERSYSHLKDHLLPKNIFVKGHEKVSLVLMSAVICLSVLKHLQYFVC